MLKALLSLRDETQFNAVLLIFVTLLFLLYWDSHSADLMASWVAGHFLHTGQPEAVYAAGASAFSLQPHPSWAPLLDETAYKGPLYPYIYPPLWAWLVGHLPSLDDFWLFMVLMTLANAVLLAAIVRLAVAAARPKTAPSIWAITLTVLFVMTSIGHVPMMQNQPHILVSFLLVLTIERSRAGDQVTAGVALALAASLKLTPALFALAFLALGQRRAFGSFVVAGGALAAASVAVAGWPLHLEFLAEIKRISNTVLVTAMSFNVHSSIAQLFFAESLIAAEPAVIGLEDVEGDEFYYAQAGAAAVWAGRLAMAASIGWCLWLLRRSSDATRYSVVWPLMIALTAITSPLSWSYYFIPAVAFLPVLYDRFGFREGRLAILLIMVPLTHPFVAAYADSEIFADTYQIIGTAAMLGLTAAFAMALREQPLKVRHGETDTLRQGDDQPNDRPSPLSVAAE